MAKSKLQRDKERAELEAKAEAAGIQLEPKQKKEKVEQVAEQAPEKDPTGYLAILLESFFAGSDVMIVSHTEPEANFNPCNSERVASELVGRYGTIKGVLRDKNNVAYDGALRRDVHAALEAAINRGRILEHIRYGNCVLNECDRCVELGVYNLPPAERAKGLNFLTMIAGLGKTAKVKKGATDDEYQTK